MKKAVRPTLAHPQPAVRLRATSRDGTSLHVEVHGPDRADVPTVVLIHGWTCTLTCWGPVIRSLRGQLRIIAYDQRGHGASDPTGPGPCDTSMLADDLTAVLRQALPPGQTAVLAGHSMGGMTIIAAADRPEVRERASGVLLASTGFAHLSMESLVFPFRRAPGLAAAARSALISSAMPLGQATAVTRAILKYMTLGPASPKDLVALNADMILACDRRHRAAWGRVLAGLDITHGPRHLDVPTRVLVGSADRMTPPVHAHRLAQHLPLCHGVTTLPGIGHMTPLEAPGAIAALIRRLALPAAPEVATAPAAASAVPEAAAGPEGSEVTEAAAAPDAENAA
jgi:pimeloyl-ACP methyl ester carboxylesterase